ncbi:MAG: phosphotransferase [Anaerolineae bacterium]|nr:phosphotransferase [Anaerolineae bacterium]
MSTVITDTTQVTPEWLTETLRRANVLPQGQVVSVDQHTSRPFGSVVSRLKLSYSDDAPSDAPPRLFLKLAEAENHQQHPERGRRESEFYGIVPVADFARLPLPRCYSAAHSTAGFHLLLDDLSETYVTIPHPLPPNQRQSEQAVDALAMLHAYWWDSPKLGQELGTPPEEKSIFFGVEQHYPAFADFLGDALWAERRGIFERVLANKSKLTMRLASRSALTLVHGDAHAWNFLYPAEGTACLVDWEAYDVDVGISDLAYLMTLFWFPAHRARDEMRLVRRYHEQLIANGVKRYDWAVCWDDYRYSVIRLLFMPIVWWHEKQDSDFWAELWWPRLERVLCAFEDLGCEALLS